jgi:hypothetical protein
MHLNSSLTIPDVLWTLTFAAHLVLLVVLLGKERAGRFPLFTASIALVAFRLLTTKLLFGRMSQMTMVEFVIITAVVGVVIGLLVLLELSRKAFVGVKRATWVAGALIVMAIGAAVLKFWGIWPAWDQVRQGSPFQLLQLIAQKGTLLEDVENILVGLLIILFGSRYGAGWRTHTQRIAIGLSTGSIGQLAVQGVWQAIAKHVAPKSVDEYNHLIALRERLFNANSMLFFAVLVWWIITLWLDEPGTVKAAATEGTVVAPEGTVVESDAQPLALESGPVEVLEDPENKPVE